MGHRNKSGPRYSATQYGFVSLALVAAVALVLVALALNRPTPASSSREAREITLYTAAPVATAQPFPADLPSNANVVIVGDSWTAGYGAADPAHQNWADVGATSLGWNLTKFALGGAGYTKDGKYQQFTGNLAYTLTMAGERSGDASGIDLVVIQGGINDTAYREDPETLNAAFNTTIETAKVTFPNASIVVLGPMPPTDDYELAVEQVSRILAKSAATAQIPYIDANKLGWFGAFNREGRVAEELVHPNEIGYAYIATTFADYVRAASAS